MDQFKSILIVNVVTFYTVWLFYSLYKCLLYGESGYPLWTYIQYGVCRDCKHFYSMTIVEHIEMLAILECRSIYYAVILQYLCRFTI
jgi:hypothetical protein